MDPKNQPSQRAQNNPSNQGDGMSLPAVNPAPQQPAQPQARGQAAQPSAPQGQSAQQPQPPAQNAQATPAPDATQQGQAQTTAASDSPQIADDTDLIEKEWVEKAKELVEQTKNDPYNQNKQINKIKADYLKKRYNKDVQLSKD